MLRWFNFKRKPLCPYPESELRKWYLESGMTPEIYAAKRSHRIGCFSFDEFSFKDKELERWIYQFCEIYHDPKKLDACRRKHLSDGEYLEISQFIDDVISGRTEL
jgi:hypothetical protein